MLLPCDDLGLAWQPFTAFPTRDELHPITGGLYAMDQQLAHTSCLVKVTQCVLIPQMHVQVHTNTPAGGSLAAVQSIYGGKQAPAAECGPGSARQLCRGIPRLHCTGGTAYQLSVTLLHDAAAAAACQQLVHVCQVPLATVFCHLTDWQVFEQFGRANQSLNLQCQQV